MKLGRRGYTLVELMVAMLILIMFMGVLASFYLSATKSAATSRRAAWAGQVVEQALTMLHQELASATNVVRINDTQLFYHRIRDDKDWIILVENMQLIRRNYNNPDDVVVLSRDITTFEFLLPSENVDAYGNIIDPSIIWILVGSGKFTLDDKIYLRNQR